MKQVLNGNNDVVELLERCLRYARRGAVRYAGVLMCSDPNAISLETAGASDMEDQLPAVLDRFKAGIDPKVKNRNDPPPRDSSLGADHVCYNVASMPLSFDFVQWILVQEMRRRRENAPAPLRVGFWFGQDGETGLETQYRAQMFEHVIQPMLRLVGAVEDRVACGGIYDQAEEFKPYRELIHRARAGERVPYFHAPDEIVDQIRAQLGGMRPLVITLREADHWRNRNSNKPAWLAFAKDRRREGHRVMFVRDTQRANDPIEDFETIPMASTNLEVRNAIYECASVNLFVSNGPAMLAFQTPTPCLMFTPIDDDGQFAAGSSRWWRDVCDMKAGEDQYPWSTDKQRIIWDLDTYENISTAWEGLNVAAIAA